MGEQVCAHLFQYKKCIISGCKGLFQVLADALQSLGIRAAGC